MEEKNGLKIALVVLLVLIVFGSSYLFVKYYNSSKMSSKYFSENEVNLVINKSTENENEVEILVEVPGMDNYQYSFDGGQTWQSSNVFMVSENKDLEIHVKDSLGNIVAKKNYSVEVVDLTGPVINITLPNEIEKGTNIILENYIEVEDISGVEDIKIDKSDFNTNTVGTKTIRITAYDKHGNKTELSFTTEVVEKDISSEEKQEETKPSDGSSTPTQTPTQTPKAEPKKTTYYRYRVKSTSSYECNYYDCSYYDESQTVNPTVSFGNNSMCCNSGHCGRPNPVVNYPCHINSYCIQVMVPKYQVKGNVCYDSSYILLTDDSNCVCSGNTCSLECISGKVLGEKTECTDGEIKLDGYCHKIDSYGEYSCPSGYTLLNETCKKKINKTCSNTCTSTSWSSWSEWTTVAIKPTEFIEVETKVV